MKNGDHPVSNSCASLHFASKKLLTTVHTFFLSFDCHVSTSFRNPVWTIEIRRMTLIYVQNTNAAAILIHQMRHTILWDNLLKNISTPNGAVGSLRRSIFVPPLSSGFFSSHHFRRLTLVDRQPIARTRERSPLAQTRLLSLRKP